MDTRERILAEARKAFLASGFKDASFRKIARNAGVTTGAIYGYVADKDALFRAVIDPEVAEMMTTYRAIIAARPTERERALETLGTINAPREDIAAGWAFLRAENDEVIRCLYQHRDAVVLVATKAQGSSAEGAIPELLTDDIEITSDFAQRCAGRPLTPDERDGIARVVAGGFAMLLDLVISYPRLDDALVALKLVNAYVIGGYRALFLEMLPES